MEGFACLTDPLGVLRRFALDKDDQRTPEGMRTWRGDVTIDDFKFSFPDPKMLTSSYEDMPEQMCYIKHGSRKYVAQICVNCGIAKDRFDVRHISGLTCCCGPENAKELLALFLAGRLVVAMYQEEGQKLVIPFFYNLCLHEMNTWTLPRQIWILKNSHGFYYQLFGFVKHNYRGWVTFSFDCNN